MYLSTQPVKIPIKIQEKCIFQGSADLNFKKLKNFNLFLNLEITTVKNIYNIRSNKHCQIFVVYSESQSILIAHVGTC